jgi:hypothetical protein
LWWLAIKRKTQKTPHYRNISKTNRKTVERGETDTSSRHIHDLSFSMIGTDTTIKNCGTKLVLWAKNILNSDIMTILNDFELSILGFLFGPFYFGPLVFLLQKTLKSFDL